MVNIYGNMIEADMENQLRAWPLYASSPGGSYSHNEREGLGPKLPEDLKIFYSLSFINPIINVVPEYRLKALGGLN